MRRSRDSLVKNADRTAEVGEQIDDELVPRRPPWARRVHSVTERVAYPLDHTIGRVQERVGRLSGSPTKRWQSG